MGLFSGKKKILVSSVVYNLAGPDEDRVNYLKTTVVGGVISRTNNSLGETITGSYLRGPGISMRNYGRWARTQGYSALLGMEPATALLGTNINKLELANQIPHSSGEGVEIQMIEMGVADYSFWADQYMLANYPDQINGNWTVDFNETENKIYIILPDSTWVSFTPAGFDRSARYIYASYTLSTGQSEGPVVVGPTVTLAPGQPFPSVTGWNQISYTSTPVSVTLNQTVKKDSTFSDGRPPESTTTVTPSTGNYTNIAGIWQKSSPLPSDPGQDNVRLLRRTMYQNQSGSIGSNTTSNTATETLPGGVTKTTVTTTTTESIVLNRTHRTDEQEVTLKTWSPLKMFIYRRGSGNGVLDAMFTPALGEGSFVPFIPMRIDNSFVSPSWFPWIYPSAKKGLKKAIGAKYDKVIDSIAENDSLGDIDYAYAVFGASLNTKDNSARRYIYEFFQQMMLGRGGDGSEYLQWKMDFAAATLSLQTWYAWKLAQNDEGSALFGTPEPVVIPTPQPPTYTIRSRSDNENLAFDMRVNWSGMNETVGAGLKKPGAKTNEVWFEKVGTESLDQWAYVEDSLVIAGAYKVDHIRAHWQVDQNTWRTLDLWGLNHENMIYKGKSVDISAIEALDDVDESGFIIPIHEDVFKSLSLKDSTQMTTCGCYLVFNCYQVVKQKWYSSSLFKVFLVVAIIVISVYTGGAGASGVGLLGANAAVGATLGFAGVAAIVAGAIANAVAAMIVMQILTTISTTLLGDKIGFIVGMIASFVAIQAGTMYMNNISMSTALSGMMRADNLLKLTVAGVNGYSNYMQASTQELIQETQNMVKDYEAQSKEISALYEQNIGFSLGAIDPMSLTEAGGALFAESVDGFLSRTLLTGSDIATMSLDMIGSFSDITLNPPVQS